MNKLDGMLSYPLSVFNSKSLHKEKRRFRVLKSKLLSLLQRWNGFKAVRFVIDVQACQIIWIATTAPLYEEIRVEVCSLNVLLIGLVAALGLGKRRCCRGLAKT